MCCCENKLWTKHPRYIAKFYKNNFIVFFFQLTESLNVITDIQQSIKYEEFMANVSRRYIENCGEVFREDILEHAQKRAMVLREMMENLRSKYSELDSLLGKYIFLLLRNSPWNHG